MHTSNKINFGAMKVADEGVYLGSILGNGGTYLTSNTVSDALMELNVLGDD